MNAMQDKVVEKMTGNEPEDGYVEKNTPPVTAKSKTKPEPKDTKLKKRDNKKENVKPEPKKKTRAEVFKQLMKTGGTKEELTKKMIKTYGGSENEAEFQVVTFCRLLITMDFAKKDENGKITLK